MERAVLGHLVFNVHWNSVSFSTIDFVTIVAMNRLIMRPAEGVYREAVSTFVRSDL